MKCYPKDTDKSSILVYHHLGLGDHIMCHGIIREYCNSYRKVGLICHTHNYPSISFMFRDLKNLEIHQGGDDFARALIASNDTLPLERRYDKIKIIGFENLNRESRIPLEQQFYALAGVDIKKKWSLFYVNRDIKQESMLYEKIKPKQNYAFIHQDVPRNFTIQKNKISKKLALIEPNKTLTNNIFDYCTLIEHANEVHVIDSSFMFLIEHLTYKKIDQKLFIHRYARENSTWKLPILQKNWKILNWYNISSFIFYMTKPLYLYTRKLVTYIKTRFSFLQKRKALFLDRDGVICEAMEHGTDVISPEQFILMPGIMDVIKTAKDMGYVIVVATNQSAVAKGTITEKTLGEIHLKMQTLLGNNIDKIYYCPHSKTDACDCRKPKPGLLIRAIDELHIDPRKSIMVGDKESDVLAGQAVGCKTVFLDSPIHGHRISECKPDIVIKNLSELLMVL